MDQLVPWEGNERPLSRKRPGSMPTVAVVVEARSRGPRTAKRIHPIRQRNDCSGRESERDWEDELGEVRPARIGEGVRRAVIALQL